MLGTHPNINFVCQGDRETPDPIICIKTEAWNGSDTMGLAQNNAHGNFTEARCFGYTKRAEGPKVN